MHILHHWGILEESMCKLGMCISGKNTIQYSLRSIRKSVNQEPLMHARTHARTHAPRIHAHTMTQKEAFMIWMKSNSQFNVGLGR